jgi:hypothetical protein
MKAKNVIIYLPGYGLGDLYNFGFYVLPKIFPSFRRIHLITEFKENIFAYQKNVHWVYLKNKSALKHALEKIIDGGQISEIIYPDNHSETIEALRSVAKMFHIRLVAPNRKYINYLVDSEKVFYFNVNLKIFKHILKNRFHEESKTAPKFFGRQEVLTLNKYINLHKINSKKLNIAIFPNSNKKVKSLPRSNLLKLIKFFNVSDLVNVFIVIEKKLQKHYRVPKFMNVYTLDTFSCKDIFYLIRRLDICVTVDTGFLQIANYLNKKVIGLFGPTDGNLSVMNKNILEVGNLIQRNRCLFKDTIVYKNTCVKSDFCIHNRKSFSFQNPPTLKKTAQRFLA